MKRKLLGIILIVLFFGHLGFRVFEYRESYLEPFDPSYWKLKYDNSQWSTKPACENPDPHYNPYTCVWDDEWFNKHGNDPAIQDLKRNAISDDVIYTHAGWEYLHGHDPTTLNAELPPFGKYLIGLSALVFNNQNIFALVVTIITLGAFYLLSTTIIKDKVYALIPVVLISLEPLFYSQIAVTLLDMLYLGLLCFVFYFLLKRKFILSAIFLGLMAATKSTATTFILVIAVSSLYFILTKQYPLIKRYLFSLPVAGIVFLATYIQYFLLGHSFWDFLGVQKYVVTFYADGAKGSFSAPWEMIFTGSFANWFEGRTVVSDWHIGWPLLVAICLIISLSILILCVYNLFYKTKLKKQQKNHTKINYFAQFDITNNTGVVLVSIWIIGYLFFLSFVPLWPRYFLLVLPFMYTLAIWLIIQCINKHEKA